MNLSPLPIQKFFDNNGRPLVDGLLFTYEAGTTTKIATYTDSSGGTPNTNPIVLDFRGECRVWIDPQQAYKFVLASPNDTDPPTSSIWTVDNITAAPQAFDNTAVDTGSVNNISLSIPQISSPVAFARVVFQAANTNTGATTLQINGGTAHAVVFQNGRALGGQEIIAGGEYQAIFDGGAWQLQGPTLVGPFDPRLSITIPGTAFTTDRNVAWGYQSFENATPGVLNVAIGYRAQRNALTGGGGLTNAQGNTAVGANCMSDGVLTGDYNTAVGYLSMLVATTAYCNAALGIRTLTALTSGQYNTAIGCDSCLTLTTGDENTGCGAKTLLKATTATLNTALGSSALYETTTGSHNTAAGALAGEKQTIGTQNTYVGYRAGQENIINSFNTAVGYFTLRLNTAASNTAVGHQAMAANTTGTRNTAVGNEALENNDDGNDNTAVGLGALELALSVDNCTAVGKDALNTNTADNNTALGYFAGRANTTGTRGAFLGRNAGLANTSGSDNVAVGDNAMAANTNNSGSVAVGSEALLNSDAPGNTALGYQAGKDETTGLTNTFIGYQAGVGQTPGVSNSTSLGNAAVCTGSNQITFGNTSITTLRAQVTTITAISDRRFKKNIRALQIPDEFLDEVEIVVYEWIDEGMPAGPQVGVIAQQLDALQEKYEVQWLNLVDKSNPDRWEATPGKLLFLLVPAHQRLRRRVSALEACSA